MCDPFNFIAQGYVVFACSCTLSNYKIIFIYSISISYSHYFALSLVTCTIFALTISNMKYGLQSLP